MAISVNWLTKVISIPQADLIHITGTLYELDTDAFRLDLKAIEESEGIPFDDTHRHNTEFTVAGVTFARTIEIINGYSITFEDGQYSVRLAGSNNNFFDVENNILNQNQVQVIPGNAAGLIVTTGEGGGLTQQEHDKLLSLPDKDAIADQVWDESVSDHNVLGSMAEFLKYIPKQFSNEWWVDPDGDDLNTGKTPGESFKTITKAISEASAGDTIRLKTTNYSENGIDITKAGIKLIGNGSYLTSSTSDTIKISNSHVEIKDMWIAPNSSYRGIYIYSGDSVQIENVTTQSGVTGFELASANFNNRFINCISTNTVEGFKITGMAILENCKAVGNGSGSVGFNSAGGMGGTIYKDCVSKKNEDASFRVASGASHVSLIRCSYHPNDGDIDDQGTNTAIIDCYPVEESLLTAVLKDYSAEGSVGKALLSQDFEGYVWIDPSNGTAGTEYPIGTRNKPVDNLPDAKTIAASINTKRFMVMNDLEIDETTNWYEFHGYGYTSEKVVSIAIEDVDKCIFKNVAIQGACNNNDIYAEDCVLGYLEGVGGTFINCVRVSSGMVFGDDAHIISPRSTVGGNPPYFDMNNTGNGLTLKDLKDEWSIRNITSGTFSVVKIHSNGATVTLEDTCTGGTILLEGIGTLIDNSTGSTVVNNMMSRSNVALSVWDSLTADHQVENSFGELLFDVGVNAQFMADIEGGKWKIFNNQMIFYKPDGVTEIARFNLRDSSGQPTEKDIYERDPV